MIQEQKEVPHIIIVGSGFGGIYAYRNLKKRLGKRARFTIVSPDNHFTFTPLLHEVATGSIEANHILEAFRTFIDPETTTIVHAYVTKILEDEKMVETKEGTLSYDYLVLATGSRACFYGIRGAEENSIVLKSVYDAIALRERVISMFDKAEEEPSEEVKKELLSFVVVGGGPTGVELASEIHEFTTKTLCCLYSSAIEPPHVTVSLVTATPELVPMFPEKMRRIAAAELARKGIQMFFNKKIVQVSDVGVSDSEGQTVKARTTIWCAGIEPNTPEFSSGTVELHKSGRIIVDEYLRVPTHPEIYVIGDVGTMSTGTTPQMPTLAQVAVAEARYLGRTLSEYILHGTRPTPFSYTLKGELVSLGRFKATGEIFGITIQGFIAWFIWRTVYLFKFVSASKRFKIMLDWTINLFMPRDITSLSFKRLVPPEHSHEEKSI